MKFLSKHLSQPLHEGPVNEHEGQTVVGIIIIKNFPCNGLLVRDQPPHAGYTYSGWQMSKSLKCINSTEHTLEQEQAPVDASEYPSRARQILLEMEEME